MEYIIYCHTHSGCRTEGMYLIDKAIENNYGIAVFDFRASGYSNGRYVTLGWFEALDINAVCNFLYKEAMAKSIAIWGRSMGASSTIFFLSPKYRKVLNKLFLKSMRSPIDWFDTTKVDCIIIDSCFNFLT